MKNFDRPYHSKSIHEFWKRWHISLSSWFKDYLYISLGGNRVSIPRWYLNLFVVFLVSGLWHGANWTFILWGATHGFYSVFAILTKKWRERFASGIGLTKVPKFYNGLQIIITFILTSFAWIFFRANHVSDAFYIIGHSFIGVGDQLQVLMQGHRLDLGLGATTAQIWLGVIAIILMEVIHVIQYRVNIYEWVSSRPMILRWSIYYLVFFMILFLGVWENREFIYFQF